MLRDDIVKELEENRGVPLSGQYLADKYNVSRNAVWKTVNALKKSGYVIVSGKNSGYYLAEGNDIISEQGIRYFLGSDDNELPIKVYDVIDSTNNEAKRLMISDDVSRMLLVANQQTAGRGRLGRNFYSPADSGIYMSLIYRVPGGVKNPMMITMAAAVAVVRAIEKLTDIRPGIKWVNDIFVGDKKVCGILSEAVTDLETGMAENIVVGIGINMKKSNFPEELRSIASSLYAEDVTRNHMIAEVTNNLIELFGSFDAEIFMPEYISHNIVVGKRVGFERIASGKTVQKAGSDDGADKASSDGRQLMNAVPVYEKVYGTVKEVCSDGALLVVSDDGTEERIFTGEIKMR